MDRAVTCCFTGHRRLPKEKIEHIIKRLDQEVDNLISQGVTDFISGGALGFDYEKLEIMRSEMKSSQVKWESTSNHFA